MTMMTERPAVLRRAAKSDRGSRPPGAACEAIRQQYVGLNTWILGEAPKVSPCPRGEP